MAELVVKVQYASKMRSGFLWALRLLFPLWGIVGPIAAVIGIFTLFSVARSQASEYTTTFFLQALGVVLGGLVVPAICLLATRTLSLDCIVADKNGLQLPLNLRNLRRYWPWQLSLWRRYHRLLHRTSDRSSWCL